MKKSTEYPINIEERLNKNTQQKSYQRHLDALKVRHQTHKQHQGSYRKHNSPDYSKYRTNQPKNTSPRARPALAPANDDYLRPSRRDEDEVRSRRPKELAKTNSIPSLDLKQLALEENENYKKLHQKLSLIETKIANMKHHVMRKRQEKMILLENKRQKQQEREEEQEGQEEQAQPHSKPRNNGNLKQFVTSVPEHTQLHTFENSPYSPKHNTYYISEIIKSYKDEKSLGREHLLTSLHIFKVLENSRFANDEEMKQRQVTLPRREGFEGKKSVVFDLDETLIHCNDTLTPPYDVKLPITFPTGEIIQAGINIRPYAQEILKNLSKHFEIIVFTASHSCYANVVLDYLDPDNLYIHHRLFREHCYQTPEGMYCKDLRVLDRELSQVALIDNAAYSYAAQPDNGIPILPYYHGKTDFQLKVLEHYLLNLVMLPDVRQLNRQTFQFHLYQNYYSEPELLVEQIYMQEDN